MQIIGAFDVHRKQITYKWLDTETGEIQRGRIMPGVRKAVREFLVPFEGLDAHFALESTTGWRFVADELSRVGLGRASRRAGRHRRAPRIEAASQDRSP